MRLAELTDKYLTMTRAEDEGALDGANNVPKSDAVLLSKTEIRIRDLAQGDLDELGAEQRKIIDGELVDIATRSANIPFAINHTAGEFRVLAENIVQEAGQELINLYAVKLGAEKDYRYFKVSNGLKREAAPARSLFEAWSYLVLMLVIDGCLNAFFFKDVGSLGLADGFLIAVIMAGCNIALGFLIGWGPLRFFKHRYKLHLLWAVPVFALLVLLILAFNWGIAHYRDLVQVNVGSTLPDVWESLRNKPFAVMSFPSYLMALVGGGVAIYASTRAYGMFDAYPWYGWTYRHMKSAENEFYSEAATIKSKIQAKGEEYLSEARKIFRDANSEGQKLLIDYDGIASRLKQFEANAQIIEDACNAVLCIYREQNELVRDKVRFPPPAYFGDEVVLRRRSDMQRLDTVGEERADLNMRIDALRNAQAELERKVPEIKLELLSESRMNARLDETMAAAKKRHDDKQREEEAEEAREGAHFDGVRYAQG